MFIFFISISSTCDGKDETFCNIWVPTCSNMLCNVPFVSGWGQVSIPFGLRPNLRLKVKVAGVPQAGSIPLLGCGPGAL